MSTIPSRVDVIIFGTGLTNSIVAAACSRIGKSVLHLDENTYYGKNWASFTFQQLIDWIRINDPNNESLESIPDELIQKSRMFCIDLAPKFLYSNGDMVDLLVKSNVSRYHEFKNNIRILCCIDNDIHVMPCRRNEVFTSALLNDLADKRRLMKFIELCMKYDPDSATDEELKTPIKQYLEDRGLKPTLQDYIIDSIAMVRSTDPTHEACQKIKKFMIATERYGRSPFLFPLYGCGEFPQSFCRLSAVFGGLYCLNTQIKDVTTIKRPVDVTGQPKSEGLEFSVKFSDDNHTVTSDILVVERTDAINLKLVERGGHNQEYLSRAVLFTRKSIVTTTDSDMVSFLRIPPTQHNPNTVYLIELNSSVLVCPKDMHVVYLWSKSLGTPDKDLEPTVARLFKDIIWKFYYRQSASFLKTSPASHKSTEKPGLFMTDTVWDDIDYSSNIKEAETLFRNMCPDEEFLPRAPDPDEIISC